MHRRRNSVSAPAPPHATAIGGPAPSSATPYFGSPAEERAGTHALLVQLVAEQLPRSAGYTLDPLEDCTQYGGGILGIGLAADEVDFGAVHGALERVLGPELAERCRLKTTGTTGCELQVPETLAAELRAVHSQAQQQHAFADLWREMQQRPTKEGSYTVPWRILAVLTATIVVLVAVLTHPELLDVVTPAWQTTTEITAPAPPMAAGTFHRPPPGPAGAGPA